MTAPGCGCCASTTPTTRSRDRLRRLRDRPAAVPGPDDPDRQWRRISVIVPLAPARPRHRPPLHQAPPPRGSTARWSAATGSTPRSSTASWTASSSTTLSCSTNKLAEWENFYNYHRPHGGLGGQTPYERLRQKTQTPIQRSTSAAHRSGGPPEGEGLRPSATAPRPQWHRGW